MIVFVRQVPEAASLRLRIESAEVLEDTERESEDERDDESSDGAGSGDGNDKKKGKPKPEKKKEKKEEKKEKKAVSAGESNLFNPGLRLSISQCGFFVLLKAVESYLNLP